MSSLIAHYGIFLVALIIYAGEIGLPTFVPGEVALLIAGSQVIHSIPALVGALILFGLVDITATSTIHVASRTGGNRILLRMLRHWERDGRKREDMIDRWRRRLGGRDALVVFVTRLIPIFRLYASISTGLIRIRLRDFVTGAAPAAVLWAATPLTVGYVLRSQLGSATGQYQSIMHIVVLSSVSFVALMATVWLLRNGRNMAAVLRRF